MNFFGEWLTLSMACGLFGLFQLHFPCTNAFQIFCSSSVAKTALNSPEDQSSETVAVPVIMEMLCRDTTCYYLMIPHGRMEKEVETKEINNFPHETCGKLL